MRLLILCGRYLYPHFARWGNRSSESELKACPQTDIYVRANSPFSSHRMSLRVFVIYTCQSGGQVLQRRRLL